MRLAGANAFRGMVGIMVKIGKVEYFSDIMEGMERGMELNQAGHVVSIGMDGTGTLTRIEVIR